MIRDSQGVLQPPFCKLSRYGLDGRFPRWIGALALAGGVPTAIAGVAISFTGFFALTMGLNLPAASLLIR